MLRGSLLIRVISLVGRNSGNSCVDLHSPKLVERRQPILSMWVDPLGAMHHDRRQTDFRLKIDGMCRFHTQPGATIFHAGAVVSG